MVSATGNTSEDEDMPKAVDGGESVAAGERLRPWRPPSRRRYARTSIYLPPPVIDSILSTTVPVGEIDTSPSAVVGCDMWSPRDTSSLFGLEWAEGPGAPGPPGLPLPLPPLRPYLSDSYVRVYNPCQALNH